MRAWKNERNGERISLQTLDPEKGGFAVKKKRVSVEQIVGIVKQTGVAMKGG